MAKRLLMRISLFVALGSALIMAAGCGYHYYRGYGPYYGYGEHYRHYEGHYHHHGHDWDHDDYRYR